MRKIFFPLLLCACIQYCTATELDNGKNAVYQSIVTLYTNHKPSDTKVLLALINFVVGSATRRTWFTQQELTQLAQFRTNLMKK
jgi:hypothetical protein